MHVIVTVLISVLLLLHVQILCCGADEQAGQRGGVCGQPEWNRVPAEGQGCLHLHQW